MISLFDFLSVLGGKISESRFTTETQSVDELDGLSTALLEFATQPTFREEISSWQKRIF
jgi:hypothetical protein